MTDEEYREFLKILYRRYIQPTALRSLRLQRSLRLHMHHFENEFLYHLEHAERSVRLFRFIEQNCNDDVYDTIKPVRVANAVSDTRHSLDFGNRTMEEAGFLDAFEAHATDILEGLRLEHLPALDKEVIRATSSSDADAELAELVYRTRAFRHRVERLSGQVSIGQQLRHVSKRVSEIEEELKDFNDSEKENKSHSSGPRKPRRWFKGLGQIGQGAALSIANIALAIGVIQFPVSPETQTWGALASVATGIGTILTGVGDLYNE